MLACAEGWGAVAGERPYLPRACSVARAHSLDGELVLEFLLEDVGPGTRRLLGSEPGEELWLTGPLGLGFLPPEEDARVILVGGGAGVAPLIIWHDWLAARDRPAQALLGFRTAGHAEAASLLPGARVTTDDGSVGRRGPVTDLLRTALEEAGPALVCACGPPAMLEAVRTLCLNQGATAQLALEAPMACGYGACYGCVVATTDGYARVCVDGPVFEARRLASLEGLEP
jgi:NAD(P)H-flavin reductase